MTSIELGRSGLQSTDGTIHEERLKELSSAGQRVRTYREMADNDPIVGSVLFVTDMLIRQVDWKVEPFNDPTHNGPPTTADIESARFVDSCFEDLNRPFKDVISEALSFLTYGWCWMELVFKHRDGDQGSDTLAFLDETGSARSVNLPPGVPSSKYDDGRIGWHKMAGRSQDTLQRWRFDEAGELVGMVQMAPPVYKEVLIPLAKSLHFRTTSMRNNPEGRSILRNAYRPWYFKKVIEEIQAVGIERDLAGLPVMYVPEDLMRSDLNTEQRTLRTSLEQLVRNVRRGNQDGILIPRRLAEGGGTESLYELKLLSSGGARQFDTKQVLEYYDQRIAVTSVADFVLLGHKAVGSFALADNKTNIFAMAIRAWLGVLADQFNERAIPQLLRLNGMDATRSPRLIHSDIETVDLTVLSTYLTALTNAGIDLASDEVLGQYLRAQASLPGGSDVEL